MTDELKNKLISLADKYETRSFIEKDPSKFMHEYNSVLEQEIVAFVSANLAFGRREQILLHIKTILNAAGKSPSEWILSDAYRSFFVLGKKSFYRMYTHDDMLLFFDGLKVILQNSTTIGEFFHKRYLEACRNNSAVVMANVISSCFDEKCALLPHTVNSAAKKVNMMLRWLVRDNSPVDLGLWTWYDKKNLLMPLDTHVMQEATRFGLLSLSASGKIKGASYKTAVELTDVMKEVFPEDPLKGDFALFGLGVDSNR